MNELYEYQNARCNNKNSEGCPSNQVCAAALTSASDEKLQPLNCFFNRVGLKTYQHPCTMRSCVLYLQSDVRIVLLMELGWKRWTGHVACVVMMNYDVATFRIQCLKRKEDDDIKMGLREL